MTCLIQLRVRVAPEVKEFLAKSAKKGKIKNISTFVRGAICDKMAELESSE
jgi:hypothetical protein